MKNILLSFLILFSSNLIGQNDSDFISQKENFTKAEQALKESMGLYALQYYHQVCFANLNTDFEFTKIDHIDEKA